MTKEMRSVNILVSHYETDAWPDMVRFFVRNTVKAHVLYSHFRRELNAQRTEDRLSRMDKAIEAIKERYKCEAEVISAYAGIDFY